MLSKRLSSLRKSKKLTQAEQAKVLGIARTTYAMYEQGNREPDYDTLTKIANYFGVSTDYLLGLTDKPNTDDRDPKTEIAKKIATEFPDIDLMFHDLESLSAEDLKEVYEYIKFKKNQKEK
ncbi:helix-turn-helix domain-containing protein [Bacillus sp. JCM 19034]|uniref:helix-turn-helix domain-containing protein n=1 Tax=Bacillus sp. JCM 19034 TaxID=1481928 RepID=UPI000786431E|nr:helix-turn-helix transcriptional regulator [Bacillus sp. JCM 19034]